MTQAYVTPRLMGDGTVALVRQPSRNWLPLPAEGGWVQLDEYWCRRLRDGDVLEAEPPAQPEDDLGSLAGSLGANLPEAERDADGKLVFHPLDLTDEERAALPPLDPVPPETTEPTASKRRGR